MKKLLELRKELEDEKATKAAIVYSNLIGRIEGKVKTAYDKGNASVVVGDTDDAHINKVYNDLKEELIDAGYDLDKVYKQNVNGVDIFDYVISWK